MARSSRAVRRSAVIGANPRRNVCDLYFTVQRAGVAANPTSWLKNYVGHAPPVLSMFGTKGFDLASFNMLGASHTVGSSKYATYPSRLNRAEAMLNARGLDVVGTQEFQERQFDYFVSRGYSSRWGAYYWDPAGKKRDTENLIMWRRRRWSSSRGPPSTSPTSTARSATSRQSCSGRGRPAGRRTS